MRIGAFGVGGAVLLSACSRGGELIAFAGGTTTTSPETPESGGELVAIPALSSVDGVLAAAVVAEMGSATINGEAVSSTSTYNGNYPSETWRVRPGDVFRIALTNDLDAFTNLHWHGMHVSPNDNADNIFLQIDPGETFDYEVAVPADHPAGLYWYHPHYHTTVDAQVYGGMGGVIVVEGGWRELPGIVEAAEKVMVLKSVVVDDGALTSENKPQTSNELWTINGQVNPQISVRPGERQLWGIANLSNDAFFRLALEGHDMTVVAVDGVGVPATYAVDAFILPPAGRVEVMVEPGDAGTYQLNNEQVDQGFMTFDQRTLATMVVAGEAISGLPPIPASTDDTLEDFRLIEPDVFRDVTFNKEQIVTTDGQDANTNWLICDLTFDPSRVDVTARLGEMEEWTLRNIDTEDHPFHIHQNDFQVVEINGIAQDFVGYNDTVTIPRGGVVKIRQRYTQFVGKWVFHCHILFHEDHGMMQTIEVVDTAAGAPV